MPGGAAQGLRRGAEGEGGRVGALRGGKLRAAEIRRSGAPQPRGAVCLGEAAAPAFGPASSRAARGRGRRPLLRRGLCRWLPRRRNMESKAGPSCRLVFCLLISAAVLRPGEQGPQGSPRPTRAGGNFLRSGPGPRTSGAVRAGVWGK